MTGTENSPSCESGSATPRGEDTAREEDGMRGTAGAVAFEPAAAIEPPPVFERDGVRITQLSRTDHYVIDRIDTDATSTIHLGAGNAPEVLMMLAGRGELPPQTTLETGRTVMLPAALPGVEATLAPGASMLRVMLPGHD